MVRTKQAGRSSAGAKLPPRNRAPPKQPGRYRPGTVPLSKPLGRRPTPSTPMIPKAAFERLVKELLQDLFRVHYRVQKEAIMALQDAAEEHVVRIMEDAKKYAIHAQRKTLKPKDIQLAKDIRGIRE